jgi:hypothetical protein
MIVTKTVCDNKTKNGRYHTGIAESTDPGKDGYYGIYLDEEGIRIESMQPDFARKSWRYHACSIDCVVDMLPALAREKWPPERGRPTLIVAPLEPTQELVDTVTQAADQVFGMLCAAPTDQPAEALLPSGILADDDIPF